MARGQQRRKIAYEITLSLQFYQDYTRITLGLHIFVIQELHVIS